MTRLAFILAVLFVLAGCATGSALVTGQVYGGEDKMARKVGDVCSKFPDTLVKFLREND